MSKQETMLVGERTFYALLLVLTLGIGYLAYDISGFSSLNSPGAFPIGASAIMLLSAVLLIVEMLAKTAPQTQGWLDAASQFLKAHFPLTTLVFLGLAVAYLAAMQFVSFYICTFVFLVLSIVYLRRGRVVSAVAVAALLLAIIYVLFSLVFSVYLP